MGDLEARPDDRCTCLWADGVRIAWRSTCPLHAPPTGEPNTATEPDHEARRHPLHPVITAALRDVHPSRPVTRIWGRDRGIEAGYEANVWAGTPEDVADDIVGALVRHEGRGLALDAGTFKALSAVFDQALSRHAAHPSEHVTHALDYARTHELDDPEAQQALSVLAAAVEGGERRG